MASDKKLGAAKKKKGATAKKLSAARKKKAATAKKTSAVKKKKAASAKKTSAAKRKAAGRKTSAAQKEVEKEVQDFKRGKARSGAARKPVKSRKQAIAIGLSKARKKGARVPQRAAA